VPPKQRRIRMTSPLASRNLSASTVGESKAAQQRTHSGRDRGWRAELVATLLSAAVFRRFDARGYHLISQRTCSRSPSLLWF
jgi:hypothetical protein